MRCCARPGEAPTPLSTHTPRATHTQRPLPALPCLCLHVHRSGRHGCIPPASPNLHTQRGGRRGCPSQPCPTGASTPAHAARWAARLPIPALPNLHLLRSGRHGCLSPPGLPCALRQAVTCPLARGRLLTSCLRYRRFGALLRGAARPEPASSHRQPSCPVPPVLACAGLSAPSRASALPPLLLFRCCAPTAAFPLPRPPRLPLRCCAPAAVPPLPSHRCRCLAMAVALPP